MPITDNASYVPTMNEFIAHWTDVDAALGISLVVVREDNISIDRVNFTNLRQALESNEQSVIDALNDAQIARGAIDQKKAHLLVWLNEFNGMLDSYWKPTPFHHARPRMPGPSDGQERFLDPMRDMKSLWTKLNAADEPPGVTLPLALSDGTLVADLQAAITALQAMYATEKDAEQDAAINRARRKQTMAAAYATMKAYRVVVPSRCRQFPTLVETLPALTPPDGHTPDAVNASAVFEAPDKSKVVYDASGEATLARYELRGNPGESYDDSDAIVILTNTPQQTREFVTNFGLTQPGTKVALKVFVVLTTGNEAGSATMVVERTV